MATTIEIHDSDVTIVAPIDESQLRQIVRSELAEVKEMIVTQSSQIHDVTNMVAAFTGDALTKLDNLQRALDNPDDSSQLSTEALAELQSVRNILIAARSAGNIGDENHDGDPAPAEAVEAAVATEAVEPAAAVDVE